MKKFMLGLFVVTLAPAVSFADAVVPGNLLVVTENTVYETLPDGTIVQSFATEYPGGPYPGTEYARDAAVDDNGIVHLYNGTFDPYMSSYDPVAESWTHVTDPEFDTSNNLSYGGIDVVGSQVFVTDALGPGGLFEFNIESGQVLPFAVGTDHIDLTIGLDGLLYALSPSGSPGGRTVDVYDPDTYAFIRTIDLTAIFGWTEHRSIAIDHNGDLFIADLDGEISHVTAAGELVQVITPDCDWIGRPISCSFLDIDISASGQLALGTRFGEILVTDTSLSSVSKFQIGDRSAFVEFVREPAVVEPTVVDIDVRPGREPNKINLSRKKNVWVAILTSPTFDATAVDVMSVALGPNGAGINRSPRVLDSDGDGDLDLRLRFRTSEIGIACGDTALTLTGVTFDGTEITGTDSIVTKGCN